MENRINYIYYFTGTGNSLQIAQDIAKGIGSNEINKISEYKGEKIKNVSGKDTLTIVFPAYYGGIPRIIDRFLDSLNVDENIMIYVVTNCNNLYGKAIKQVSTKLSAKNLKISGGWVINMPGNYIPMYDVNSSSVQEKKFAEEKKAVSSIVEIIRMRKSIEIKNAHPLINALFTKIEYKYIDQVPDMDKNFAATDKCIGCSKCASLCPVGNIVMKDGKPQWQHHCEMCLACLQHCPKEAIEFGEKSVGRKRYVNPNVK